MNVRCVRAGSSGANGSQVSAKRCCRPAGGVRKLADELEVGRRRQQRDEKGAAEREPGRAADAARDVTRQRIDARAEHVADHEEQQELRADDLV